MGNEVKTRIKVYAKQRGISTVGMLKNDTTYRRLACKLTPRQRRRLRKHGVG